MTQDKARDYVICTATIRTAFIALLILFPASIVGADGGQGSVASAATFRTKCAMCHGPDGGGSTVGKTMNVPDLRSETVQKRSDAELTQAISEGKGGMPSFKNSLSEDQIHGLVTYIRSLPGKK